MLHIMNGRIPIKHKKNNKFRVVATTITIESKLPTCMPLTTTTFNNHMIFFF